MIEREGSKYHTELSTPSTEIEPHLAEQARKWGDFVA
jgi:hypothetical protein